jgi:hypothetical protein
LDSETGQCQGLLTELPVSGVESVRLRSADEHPRSLLPFMGVMVSPCERKKSMNFYTGRVPHVPPFGTWVLGCSDPTLNFFPKNKKGRNRNATTAPSRSKRNQDIVNNCLFPAWVLHFPECPAASEASLASGTENRATPQSRQINTVGNNQTPGLFTFLSPTKCSMISLPNSTGLPTRHDGHDIRCLSLMIHPAFEATITTASTFVRFGVRQGLA